MGPGPRMSKEGPTPVRLHGRGQSCVFAEYHRTVSFFLLLSAFYTVRFYFHLHFHFYFRTFHFPQQAVNPSTVAIPNSFSFLKGELATSYLLIERDRTHNCIRSGFILGKHVSRFYLCVFILFNPIDFCISSAKHKNLSVAPLHYSTVFNSKLSLRTYSLTRCAYLPFFLVEKGNDMFFSF